MKNFLIIACIIFYIFSCTPKTYKQTTKEEYKEDISHLLPPIDTTKSTTTKDKQTAYVPPENSITKEMNILIDSISKDARDRKVQLYTVQVYVGNDSKEANEARMKVFEVLSDEKPRIEWSQPNFRVKVGRFTSRLEAYKILTNLKKTFPGALLVPERVYLNQ